MKPTRVEISYKTIVFTAAFIALLLFIWQIRSILAIFFVCFIMVESLNPAIERLEKLKISRPFAILFIYAIILSFVTFAFAGVVPIFVEQTTGLIRTLPQIFENINIFGISASTVDWSSQLKILENLPSEVAKAAISLFSNVLSGFFVLVITFYMLLERRRVSQHSQTIFGSRWSPQIIKLLERLEARLGNWVNAELILMFSIGVLSYLGYTVIGLEYAVPLAIIAGLLEAVPGIGPTVASILAGFVGLTVSPLVAGLAIIWGIIIQQLEGNFLVPKVMSATIGLNPLITILVLTVGAKLGGLVGAILGIPIYLTLEVLLHTLVVNKKSLLGKR